MNTWKRYVPMAFAVIFAVLSSVSVYFFLKDRSGVSHASPISTLSVVVAKTPIAIGEKLKEHDLEAVSWPQEAAPKTSYRSVRQLIGKTARVNMDQNEPVLESKLLADGENFSSLIPEDMRAVTVAVKRSDALAKILERGTLVDVLSLFVYEETGIVTAETIVGKALVLSVHKEAEAATNGRSQEKQKQMEVTLIVKPKEAERIIAAMSQGGIDLVVRNDQVSAGKLS